MNSNPKNRFPLRYEWKTMSSNFKHQETVTKEKLINLPTKIINNPKS
jgi:hypothetical protein